MNENNPNINYDECLKIGTILKSTRNSYKITEILGQGGCGITYLAEAQNTINGNMDDRNRVAIKEFFIRRTPDKTYCTRVGDDVECVYNPNLVKIYRDNFKKEIERIRSIPHHNVVKTFDQIEANQTDYYVMEYGAGGALGSFQFAMPEDDAIKIIKDVAGVISILHQRNTLHLDIKPDNIVLRQNGEPIVIDFGISKKFESNGHPTTISEQAPHSDGYSPIEQYSPVGINQFTPQTDIYALGATLYRLVTAQEPLAAQTIAREGFPVFPDIISEKTKHIIMYAMQPDINRRPKDVATFANALSSGRVPSYVTGGPQSVMPANNGSTILEGGDYVVPQTNTQPTSNTTTVVSPSAAKSPNNNMRTILIGVAIVVVGVIGYKYIDSNKSQETSQQDVESNVLASNAAEETEQPTISQTGSSTANKTKNTPKVQTETSSRTTSQTTNAGTGAKAATSTARTAEVVEQQTAPVQAPAPAVEMSADELLSKGVSANKKFRYEDAANYFTKAANKGNVTAMYLLGDLYYNGNGVSKSYPTAKKYFTQAANSGYAKAQYMLGMMYRNGQGGDKNIEQAKVWLQKAASQGSSEAERVLSKL